MLSEKHYGIFLLSPARFKCFAYGKRCNCRKLNHYASQCKSNKNPELVKKRNGIFVVGNNIVNLNKFNDLYNNINNNSLLITFKLDTGAQ